MGKLLTTEKKKTRKVSKAAGNLPAQVPDLKFADKNKAMKAYAKVSTALSASRQYLEEN